MFQARPPYYREHREQALLPQALLGNKRKPLVFMPEC